MEGTRGLWVGLLLLSSALASPADAGAAVKNVDSGKVAEPAGDVIHWALPWREDMALRYEAEDYDVDVDANGRESTRTTGIETLRITEARDDGYLQEWSYSDTRYAVEEGDPASAEIVEAMMAALGDLVLEVELDAAGNYAGIRNLEVLRERMRPVIKDSLLAAFDAAVAKAPAADAADAADARAAGVGFIETMIDGLTAPAMFEAILSEDALRYNDLVGSELEEGRHYDVDVELDNPLGGPPLPARVTLGAYVRESEPDDVFIEWTTRADPEKAAAAAAAVADTLFDESIAGAVREHVQEVSVVDEGFVLFRRSTGVVEMLEATLTTRAAGNLSIKRRRMRLLDGDHDHGWADTGPPTPAVDPE
jgi:hypothetical protein